MRKPFCFMLAPVVMFMAATANAQQDYPRDMTVCWTNPTNYVEGGVIEAGDLELIRLEIFRNADTVPTFTATIPDDGEGVYQCETLTGVIPNPGTYSRFAYAIVVGGDESDKQAPDFKKFTGKPNPPIIEQQVEGD